MADFEETAKQAAIDIAAGQMKSFRRGRTAGEKLDPVELMKARTENEKLERAKTRAANAHYRLT